MKPSQHETLIGIDDDNSFTCKYTERDHSRVVKIERDRRDIVIKYLNEKGNCARK